MNGTQHLLLSGSFRSISLFLLAFSPLHKSLDLVQTVDALGPHQYLATNPRKDRVFTTTWATPPTLQSWQVDASSVKHINTVSITATSSYVNIPPPYTHIYSTGGPTGEVHRIDPQTGGFGSKTQEFLFVPPDELDKADKTRVALRYGSHGIEFSPATHHAFVPVLGTNTIEMYNHDPTTGHLTHLSSIPSPRGPKAHDGPRHVKIHPNGRVLYCVTEHSQIWPSPFQSAAACALTPSLANYVDAYKITNSSLDYIHSLSLLPLTLSNETNSTKFRGDTLLLAPPTPAHPAPHALFATTRGSKPDTRGWLSIFALDHEGFFAPSHSSVTGTAGTRPAEPRDEPGIERFETPTSGGKANAIDLLSKSTSSGSRTQSRVYGVDQLEFKQAPLSGDEQLGEDGVWILLTDDDESTGVAGGGVRVLEWDGWGKGGVKEVAAWPDPASEEKERKSKNTDGGERMFGGSHAIWLS
ncbi:hypothetical protein AMATHDRAFT_6618 [Amanita thiersii Skay4041]|uniref:3-carboxy-cis,cis-mucoante lactonizing enzyme n=1 Tax=Amanita thiersii Skay4041 TaxID=703135 RepID=A0A2A9NIN1_9AGAR|nr:hypothetical protein AMATHDRAFT_6618 [Amanita thiersii Skay4041]